MDHGPDIIVLNPPHYSVLNLNAANGIKVKGIGYSGQSGFVITKKGALTMVGVPTSSIALGVSITTSICLPIDSV